MIGFEGKKWLVLPILMLLAAFQIGSERLNHTINRLADAQDDTLLSGVITTGDDIKDITRATILPPLEDRHQPQNDEQISSLPPQTDIVQSPGRPLCSNEEMAHGRWLPITMKRPPYTPLSPRVRCLPSDAFSKSFATWQWQPTSSDANNNNDNTKCEIARLYPYQFCRLLSNSTVSFIGDSLTLEHFASLVHLLGDRARLPPKAVNHGRIRRHICTASPSVVFAERDNPKNLQEHCVDLIFKTDFFLQNITEEVLTVMPSVMVLNRGAHYTPDEELMSSLHKYTLPSLQGWNQKCSEAKVKCLLIWRTTVPGHPNCQNFTKPAASVPEMETWIHDTSTNDPGGGYCKGEYHWQDFQHQNLLVTRLLQDEWASLLPHISIQIMDSYLPNILRPDNHRSHMGDCLHSCSPGGGSDLNSQWLYHILLLQQQQQK